MISIKDTVGSIWIPCPKCKSAVLIEQWGEQTCVYQGCDGHKFTFEFNFDTATLILEKIQQNNIRIRSLPTPPLVRPSRPRLQKTHDGHLLVPQPDSANPDDWFHNDPFKPKS